MTNVFLDWHHGQLFYSFKMLIEDRLGWDLFRPTGLEWFDKGYWTYSMQEDTRHQYLDIPKDAILRDGYYEWETLEGPRRYTQKLVTVEQFKNMDFGFVIASVRNHEAPFTKLIQEIGGKAVLIRQAGNIYDTMDYTLCKNVLNATLGVKFPEGVNNVYYHPEFPLDDYHYEDPTNHDTIVSMLHALPKTIDKDIWYQYKKALGGFTWKMYGVLGDEGVAPEAKKIEIMRDAAFIWHLKSWGDGYGFNLHNAYALGRPPIVRTRYHEGMSAGLLYTPDTCIDLDMKDPIADIQFCATPEYHVQMCRRTHKRFMKIVNFDQEFIQIRKFFEQAAV